jgi:hypothetical protein
MKWFLVFLGFCRHPLPPISRRATKAELETMNRLLKEDRKAFP